MQQVPTLMTEHAPRTLHRRRAWIGICVVLVAAASTVAYILNSRQTASILDSNGGHSEQTTKANSGPHETSIIEGEASAQDSNLQPKKAPASAPSSERNGVTGATLRSPAAAPPANAMRQQPLPSKRLASPQDDEELLGDEEVEEIPSDELLANLQGTRGESIASPEAAKTGRLSFKEAVGNMNLSLLMTSDNKEERMVYIDGKRYGEGDYINGIYLLEKITVDGALISYQGERALLQPKTK